MASAELEAQVDALLAPLPEERERAYFERLQAAGAAPGLAVRRCGDKGKGLFATRDFEEGEVVLHEQPVVAIQQEANKVDARSCAHCFRYVGSVEEQIARRLLAQVAAAGEAAADDDGGASASTSSAAATATPLTFDPAPLDLPALAEGRKRLPHSERFPLPPAVACPGGCDDACYCSAACADAAWRRHHRLLCTGPRGEAGDAAALREFWSHTLATNDIFGLAAQVVATVALSAAAECADGSTDASAAPPALPSSAASPAVRAAALAAAWEPFGVAHRQLWWDCVSLPANVQKSGAAGFRDSLRRLADGSRRRLAAALPAQAAAWPALFHLRTYGATVGLFELNNLDVVVESPVENYFLLVDDLPEPARAAAVATTGPLLDALDSGYATPLDGTGFFAFVACANHACDPAAGSSKGEADVDGAAVLKATRRIKAGEEVTICYIDVEESSLRKRRAALEDYGFVCRCDRCAADEARKAARKAAGGAPAGVPVVKPRSRKTK